MKKFFKSVLFAFALPILPLTAIDAAPKAASLVEEVTEPIVILGGGVGSLTSAVYLGRAGISPLVIEGPNPGGLLTQSHTVQNWPGEFEIDGTTLTEKMRKQAEANGARFLGEEVISVDFSKRPLVITTRGLDASKKKRTILAESCIIAMGTKPNFLAVPGEESYWGKGVTNCAICDGSLYKNKVVGVVGGGDAAVLEALYLANIAKEVHVFVRKDTLKAIEEKRVETLRAKPNVKFHFNTTVQEVKGDLKKVTSVMLKKGDKLAKPFALDGLFLAIGSTPNSVMFKNILKLDEKGYILLQKDQQTSIPGIYAIGDIVDPVYKQAISAAGDGAKAALQAQQYLSDRAYQLVRRKEPEKKNETVVLTAVEVIDILSKDHFDHEVTQSTVPVVIDFYATWCGPCKQLSPILQTSANLLSGKVKFLKVDVDKLSDLSAIYDVQSMPTMLLLDSSGAELSRKVGIEEISNLLKTLEDQH